MPGRKYLDEVILPVQPNIIWVNGSKTMTAPTGDYNAPFLTIQDALDTLAAPTSAVEQQTPVVIMIQAGVYDEDLTLPSWRSVKLIALGSISLGAAAPYRTITIPLTGPAPYAGTITSVSICSMISPEINPIFCDDIVITSDVAEDLALEIKGFRVLGAAGPAVDATGFIGGGRCDLVIEHSRLFSADAGDAGVPVIQGPNDGKVLGVQSLVLNSLINSSFESQAATPANRDCIYASVYSHVESCRFYGDITFTGDPALAGSIADGNGRTPVGWFGCTFANLTTWTNTRQFDTHLDDSTNQSFIDGGTVFALGSAGKTTLGTIHGVGTVIVNNNPMGFAIFGARSGDIVLATIQSDDTGGPLGMITNADIAAPNTVSLQFSAAPINDDAVVGVVVIRP